MALFPRHTTPPFTWFLVLCIPVIIKVLRCANITFFVVSEIKRINSLPKNSFVDLASALFNMAPSVKIEWIIQVFDDLYVFCLGNQSAPVSLSKIFFGSLSLAPV